MLKTGSRFIDAPRTTQKTVLLLRRANHIENSLLLRGACVGMCLPSRCLAMLWANPSHYVWIYERWNINAAELIKYLFMFFKDVARRIWRRIIGWLINCELESCRSKWLCPNLRHCFGSCLERTEKTTKISVELFAVAAEIRTCNLQNTRQKFCCRTNLFSKIVSRN
jgi:hypothetical protein